MIEAFLWGFLGASSLILGAIVVAVRPPSDRTLGLIMGFGAGVLISAVSFELVEEAAETADDQAAVAFGFLVGALVYFTGDLLLERQSKRKAKLRGEVPHGEDGDALGIVLGTVLDGIPESAVLGLTLLQTGDIGVSMLVAVFVSNLPESIAASSSLTTGGWSRRTSTCCGPPSPWRRRRRRPSATCSSDGASSTTWRSCWRSPAAPSSACSPRRWCPRATRRPAGSPGWSPPSASPSPSSSTGPRVSAWRSLKRSQSVALITVEPTMSRPMKVQPETGYRRRRSAQPAVERGALSSSTLPDR